MNLKSHKPIFYLESLKKLEPKVYNSSSTPARKIQVRPTSSVCFQPVKTTRTIRPSLNRGGSDLNFWGLGCAQVLSLELGFFVL
jgi:hypothetical protein